MRSDGVIETQLYRGKKITVWRDDDAQNPDEGKNEDLFLVAWDSRNIYVTRDGMKSSDDIRGMSKNFHVFTLFVYSHGGVSLSLARSCSWDSGACGYVFVKRQGKKNERAEAEKSARSLIDEWNLYLSGQVYGFTIEDSYGDVIDSCGGFYGETSEVLKEARSIIDAGEKQIELFPMHVN